MWGSSAACIARTREAARLAVDRDTGLLRSAEIRALPVDAPSPALRAGGATLARAAAPRAAAARRAPADRPGGGPADSDRRGVTGKTKRRPRRQTPASRKKAEARRIGRMRMVVLDAARQEEDVQQDARTTPGQRALATAIRRSQETLLAEYSASVLNTQALEDEQHEWRHQSPTRRGVNTSPKNSWSTMRGARVTRLSATKATKNPPWASSDQLIRVSVTKSARTSRRLGSVLDMTMERAEAETGTAVVRRIGF